MFSVSFFVILICAIYLVVIQGVTSHKDGYFSQRQMRAHGNRGFAFVEHGGMWADVFLISPAIAYIMSHYHLEYFSWWGLIMLTVVAEFTVWSVKAYETVAMMGVPEAHTHHGKTKATGWIHAVSATWWIWVILLYFLTPINPKASPRDMVIISLVITAWAPLGLVKFNNPLWKWTKSNSQQIGGEIAVLWAITIVRIAMGW